MSEPGDLSLTMAALADPTRRSIVAQLATGDARLSDLAQRFPMSFNGVSKHVLALERAGLVLRRRSGREHWFALNRGPLGGALAWIEEQTRR